MAKRMSGNIGSLNTEMSESEVEDGEAEVRVSGMQTIVDERRLMRQRKNKVKLLSPIYSAHHWTDLQSGDSENKKQTRKGKNKGAEEINQKNSKSKTGDSPWDGSATTSTVGSVVSCSQCGVINNNESQYCTSCGDLLIQ